jgi:hypothetical protein
VQVSVKVVLLVSAALVAVPLVGRLPLHPPDAVQAVAFVLDHMRSTVLPEETSDLSVLRVTVGAGGAGATVNA